MELLADERANLVSDNSYYITASDIQHDHYQHLVQYLDKMIKIQFRY